MCVRVRRVKLYLLHVCLFHAVPWGVSSSASLVQTVTAANAGASVPTGRTVSTTIDSLRPHVQYKARVAAENALGKGRPSEQILVSGIFIIKRLEGSYYHLHNNFLQFWTESSSPSGKPRHVRVSSPVSSRLVVAWEDPDSDTWNGPLVAYKVGWREIAAMPPSSIDKSDVLTPIVAYNWTEVERHDTSDLQVVLSGLKAYTRYELLIQAVNDIGVGPTEMARARTSGDSRAEIHFSKVLED